MIVSAESLYHGLVFLHVSLSRHLKLLNHRAQMLSLYFTCHFQASGVVNCKVDGSS